MLRHAWLNLWDKHMTTGRINQVSAEDRLDSSESVPSTEGLLCFRRTTYFIHTSLLALRHHWKWHAETLSVTTSQNADPKECSQVWTTECFHTRTNTVCKMSKNQHPVTIARPESFQLQISIIVTGRPRALFFEYGTRATYYNMGVYVMRLDAYYDYSSQQHSSVHSM